MNIYFFSLHLYYLFQVSRFFITLIAKIVNVNLNFRYLLKYPPFNYAFNFLTCESIVFNIDSSLDLVFNTWWFRAMLKYPVHTYICISV